VSDHYTYRVLWSPEDGEFVGQCSEFPSLSHLAPDHVEALVGIRALVSDVVADMRRNGEPVPEPFADRTWSGRFMVRIPSDLHRRLAIEAAEDGISLNRLVSNKLASPAMPDFKRSAKVPSSGGRKRAFA
jgi:predicted HicB family RNase H-like nuclease